MTKTKIIIFCFSNQNMALNVDIWDLNNSEDDSEISEGERTYLSFILNLNIPFRRSNRGSATEKSPKRTKNQGQERTH